MLQQIISIFCFEKSMCEKLKWAVTASVKCLARTWAKPVPGKVMDFIIGSCILHKFMFQDPGLFVKLTQVNGVHPECRFQLEIHKEEARCMELLKNAKPVDYKGKKREAVMQTHWSIRDLLPLPSLLLQFKLLYLSVLCLQFYGFQHLCRFCVKGTAAASMLGQLCQAMDTHRVGCCMGPNAFSCSQLLLLVFSDWQRSCRLVMPGSAVRTSLRKTRKSRNRASLQLWLKVKYQWQE